MRGRYLKFLKHVNVSMSVIESDSILLGRLTSQQTIATSQHLRLFDTAPRVKGIEDHMITIGQPFGLLTIDGDGLESVGCEIICA
jgi:hypothetical protein